MTAISRTPLTRTPGFGARRRSRIEATPTLHVDGAMLGAVAAICALGLLMVYSATNSFVDGDPYYYVKRQGLSVALGIAVMVGVMAIDYRKLRDFSVVAYAGTILLLLAVMSPLGSASRGAQAWFQLPGGFQLQPSELAKFGIIIAVAGYCNEHRDEMDAWRLTVTIGLALVPIGLVMIQPDFGTAMVLCLIIVGMLAMAGMSARQLLILFALAATIVYAVIALGVLKDYQVDRLTAFAGSGESSTTAYNTDQSRIAIGSGGFFGTGFDEGPQTSGGFVPEQHTDFIFTAVGEELGFVGAASLLGLFALVVWRIWRTAQMARDFFGALVCIGVFTMFAFQIFENIGMTMGIMPVTGIPLPFMSYGGSGTITAFACIGLVQNVHMRRFAN